MVPANTKYIISISTLRFLTHSPNLVWCLHFLACNPNQGVAIWVLSNTTITIQFFAGNILTNNVTSIQFFCRKWSTMWHQRYFLTKLRPQYNINGILSVNWTQKWSICINSVIFSSGLAQILKNFNSNKAMKYIREAQILQIVSRNDKFCPSFINS